MTSYLQINALWCNITMSLFLWTMIYILSIWRHYEVDISIIHPFRTTACRIMREQRYFSQAFYWLFSPPHSNSSNKNYSSSFLPFFALCSLIFLFSYCWMLLNLAPFWEHMHRICPYNNHSHLFSSLHVCSWRRPYPSIQVCLANKTFFIGISV